MRKQYAVLWTWKKYDLVPTKKRGMQKLKAWKRWYLRHDWLVEGKADQGYMAYSSDFIIDHVFIPPPVGTVHAIGLREVTPEQVKQLEAS